MTIPSFPCLSGHSLQIPGSSGNFPLDSSDCGSGPGKAAQEMLGKGRTPKGEAGSWWDAHSPDWSSSQEPGV